jgi:tetratricopeptide (TPR) repeat protein
LVAALLPHKDQQPRVEVISKPKAGSPATIFPMDHIHHKRFFYGYPIKRRIQFMHVSNTIQWKSTSPMIQRQGAILIALAFSLWITGCGSIGTPSNQPPAQPWSLKQLVEPLRPSVVTVVTYDLDGEVAGLGSGFFISSSGILTTNYHVLDGAYRADVKTLDGREYPIVAVLAKNQQVDLIKVRVDIPRHQVAPLPLAEQEPVLADRVVVIGSPLGLDQTVSEGIVSAVRETPAFGKVFQLTAPISQGSSGSPVLNHQGEVVGVVSFQVTEGQNLNFAISVNSLRHLPMDVVPTSLAEWTLRNSGERPAMAAELCRKGARLTIEGQYEEALTYFRDATETNPDDPNVWYGLGSCYAGLDQQGEAVEAFKKPIDADPDNIEAHFILAMYYNSLENYEMAIASLQEVLRIDPSSLQGRFELGQAYGRLERQEEKITTLETLLSYQPDFVPALFSLGLTLNELGRHEEAVKRLQRASILEPQNAAIYFSLSRSYHQLNRPEEEIQALLSAIRSNPRLVPAHLGLGLAFISQGQTALALQQYEILRSLNPAAAEILFQKIYPEKSDLPEK